MKDLSSEEWHEAVRKALDEIPRKLASGELDQSGRFYTDEQLRAMRLNEAKKSEKKRQEPVA